jgi:DEAD/DEAH box helicase domain-containing protein
VTDSVEGYRIGNTVFHYRELSKTNRRMSRKHHEFGTTGVLLRISDPWFNGDSEYVIGQRRMIAKALAAVVAREHCIAPSDIRTAHQGIAICGPGGARRVNDTIVIFDSVVGGLRLTAPLFSCFTALLDRLERAAELAREDSLIAGETVERLRHWHAGLSSTPGATNKPPPVDNSDLLIFAPHSEVAVRIRGALVERTLLEPQFVTMGDTDVLMYRYEAGDGVQGWVAHDQIEPIGGNWQRAIWNPVSNEIRELVA